MPKVLAKWSNLFLRNNRDQLETDAQPVDSSELTNSQEPPSPSMTTNSNSSSISEVLRNFSSIEDGNNVETFARSRNQHLENSLIGTNLSESSSLMEYQQNQIQRQTQINQQQQLLPMTTNNVLAVDNTQGQVVYRFDNCNGLHLGSVYNINNNLKIDNENENETKSTMNKRSNGKREVQRTRTIQTMMMCEEPLSDEMMDLISTHLGDGWQRIMRALQFSEGQIYQAIADYHFDGGLKETIYQLLLDWRRNDDNPSLGKITKLLYKLDQASILNKMKELWKTQNVNLDNQRKNSDC